MKNFNRSQRRSEKVRRKLNAESQDVIQRASRRVYETPLTEIHLDQNSFKADSDHFGNGAGFIRRFRPGWRVFSLFLCAALGYTLVNMWQSPQFKVEQIEISGIQRLEKSEIQATLHIVGTHSFAVSTEKIRTDIMSAFPELRQVEVKIEMPAKILIEAKERQPIFSWKTKENIFWIDGEGYLIPARGESSIILGINADSVPAYTLQSIKDEVGTKKVIRDKPAFIPGISDLAFFSIPKRIDDTLLTAILQLNAWMPDEKTLLYQKLRGLGWEDSRGWDVFIGQRLEKINEKMVMYQMIVRHLEEQEINPALVSVEFLHAPYYRLEQ